MKLEQGDIVMIRFGEDKYLKFINHCFVNCLISGVDVKLTKFNTAFIFVRIAAPGIDRIKDAVEDFDGTLLTLGS